MTDPTPDSTETDDSDDSDEIDEHADTPVHDVVPSLDCADVRGTPWEYSDRGPGWFVLSGPLLAGAPGRVFVDLPEAELWVREVYGTRVVRRIDAGARWAFLIRKEGKR
jgi:hypothetical protein